MDAGSAASQSRKLGLKPGQRVALVGADPGWALADAPPLEFVDDGPADVVIAFLRSAVEVEPTLVALGERIRPAGAIWAAWPRRAAGHVSDVGDAVIREAVLPHGLVDVKVAAIDHDWSGLKIVWRLTQR
ncbi:MAG: hypothetical protein JWN36_2015 [Microbacteriaceae bacterium]|nr:hypothetical protein [Microbacteriaceae bacterium]